MRERATSGVGVLDKAARILAAVEDRPRSLAELTADTGLNRATAHRLATALESHGLLRRDGGGRFALGFRLAALGAAALRSLPLASAALPALEELREVTGESVQLYVREGSRRVCIAALESPHGLRTIVPVGAVLPLDRGSAGTVLGGGVPSTGQEWVESVEEREPGVASVSAPVRDRGGAIVAAVSVSGPLDRTGRRPGSRYGKAVAGAARRVEREASLVP